MNDDFSHSPRGYIKRLPLHGFGNGMIYHWDSIWSGVQHSEVCVSQLDSLPGADMGKVTGCHRPHISSIQVLRYYMELVILHHAMQAPE